MSFEQLSKSRLAEFADNTSCHGISPVYKSKTIFWRIVWTIALLAAFGTLIFQISTLYAKYRAMPVATRVEVKNQPLLFPSVTFCNQNPLRKNIDHSKISDRRWAEFTFSRLKLQSFEEKVTKMKSELVSKLINEARNSTDSNQTAIASDPINIDYDLLEDPRNKTEDRLLREDLVMKRHKLFQNTTEIVSTQAVDFIQWCRFLGEDCSYTNFSRFVSRDYGNCYTFNAGEMGKNAWISQSGNAHGLTAVLNIEAEQYMPVLSSAAGAKVVIHEHGSFPFPSESGYSVPVGYETDIGITVRTLHREPHPYGNCTRGKDFLTRTGKPYYSSACRSQCIHQQIINNCACYTYYKYDGKKYLREAKVRKCLTDQDVICAIRTHRDYARQKFDCLCPQPCEEVEYLTSSSLNQWPSFGYKNVLIEQICRREKKLTSDNIQFDPLCDKVKMYNLDFIRENFLAVSVYFKHLNYESITEEPAYPLPNFLSDMGGTMGLYAGISLLTGIEFVALAVGLLSDLWKALTKKEINTTKVGTTNEGMV